MLKKDVKLPKKGSDSEAALELLSPDENGFSDTIYRSSLAGSLDSNCDDPKKWRKYFEDNYIVDVQVKDDEAYPNGKVVKKARFVSMKLCGFDEDKREVAFDEKTAAALFLELAQPDDETGISRAVSIEEFTGKYTSLNNFGNGASWSRDDTAGVLGKYYIIDNIKDKTIAAGTIAVQLCGLREDGFNRDIHPHIKSALKGHRCVFCGTSLNHAVDHKNGRYDDERISNMDTQLADDFQAVCVHCNTKKREYCKVCKNTDKRYDPRNDRGYTAGWTEGDENYNRETGCNGCLMYDPIKFNGAFVLKSDVASPSSDVQSTLKVPLSDNCVLLKANE